MLRELCRRHQVTVITTDGPADDPAGLAAFLSSCQQAISLPLAPPKRGEARFIATVARSWLSRLPVDLYKWRRREVRSLIDQALAAGQFDCVIADFMFAVPNVPVGRQPMIYFAHNVEHLIWKRLAGVERRWWRRALLEIEWRKMRRAEARACRDARLTIAVSEDDRLRLLERAPDAAIVSIPTGVDLDYYRPNPAAEVPGRLVFSGSMDWYPNEDAILHFLETTLPLIRRDRPDVTLSVIGRNPTERLRAVAGPGVIITGTVDDVRPHVTAGEVYIVPLRVGGGTRLKIFEALAMGKAVVSTTIGAEGLDMADGRHAILADGPAAFSRAVVDLLNDRDRRRRLAEAGRALVEERYSWAQVGRVFEAHLQEVINRDARHAVGAERRLAVS